MASSGGFDPVEFKENIRKEWRSAAGGWRRWLDVVEAPEGGQRHSAELIALAELRPGASVLDVGGGYGEPSLTAARVVGPEGHVVCTDISEEMLATARDRADEAGITNVEFIARDAEDLDYDDETFDAVISRATLMFLPDVAGTLRRLHGFLRPGGRLAASVWGPISAVQFAAAFPVVAQELELPPPPPGQPGAFALSDPARLAALVTEAGFRDVETGTVPVDLRDGLARTVHGLHPRRRAAVDHDARWSPDPRPGASVGQDHGRVPAVPGRARPCPHRESGRLGQGRQVAACSVARTIAR